MRSPQLIMALVCVRKKSGFYVSTLLWITQRACWSIKSDHPFLTDGLGKGRHVTKLNLMETFTSMRACS